MMSLRVTLMPYRFEWRHYVRNGCCGNDSCDSGGGVVLAAGVKNMRVNKPTPKLRKTPQPPLSHAGATADADRAKRPPLVRPPASDVELIPGDRVEGLANFGKPTGEFGTVEKTNEDDALVKWDDDGRMRLRQPWLKKVSK